MTKTKLIIALAAFPVFVFAGTVQCPPGASELVQKKNDMVIRSCNKSGSNGNPIPDGPTIIQDRNGMTLAREEFQNGLKQSATHFWRNGNRKFEFHYHLNQVQSISQFSEKGSPEVIDEYSVGQDIHRTQFYENGKKALETHLHDGQRTGDWTYWYPNGQLALVETYEEGELSGPWVFRCDNGKVCVRGQYRKSHPVGAWKIFKSDGSLEKIINFEANSDSKCVGNGAARGAEYPIGLWWTCEKEEGGKIRGVQKEWYPMGGLSAESEYVKSASKKVTDGKSKSYWPNGKLKYDGSMKDGKPLGEETAYRSDGTKIPKNEFWERTLNP